jgi:hypothetical protein
LIIIDVQKKHEDVVLQLPNVTSTLSDYMITLSKTVIPAWIAGIQTPWMDLSLPSHTTTLRAGHGTGYPLPGEYDELSYNLTK